MPKLSFGQPDNGIIQLAYVVPDINAAMVRWTADLRAGPWFMQRDFPGINPIYRGEASVARVDLAFAFVGHMQIELIGPRDDAPSVYRELIGTTGYGFQHWGVAAPQFDQEVESLLARGYDMAFSAAVPSGGRVAMFDTKGALPAMIELIEADDALNRVFGAMYRAAQGWDGADPVRDMPG